MQCMHGFVEAELGGFAVSRRWVCFAVHLKMSDNPERERESGSEQQVNKGQIAQNARNKVLVCRITSLRENHKQGSDLGLIP